jgi:adenosylmethionine-8-amino-7-oxononanoate aminotransferase
MNWSDRDKKVNWHPFSIPIEEGIIAITHADGVYLYDENNTKYLDAVSSWWVNLHGHNHPVLKIAIKNHLENLDHIIFAGFTHPKAVELSEKLLSFVPGNYAKVFYSDDGSTANEVALKMALQFFYNKGEKRTKIIAFENAYHGDTFGAMSMSGKSIFNQPFESSLIEEVVHIRVPVNGYSNEEWSRIKNEFDSNTAVFIFEPLLQGSAGMVMYDANALDELISLAKSKGIITIADEVLTGFGRTGKWFATEYLKEKADLICLSKGITGGVLPLGITMMNQKIVDGFNPESKEPKFYHGHSYTANSIACAVASANLDLLNEECMKNIQRIEANHLAFKNKFKSKNVANIRVLGTILALNFNSEVSSYTHDIRNRMYSYFMKKGLLMRPLGNVCYVIPPYCITNDQLEEIYSAIIEFSEEFN